MAETGGTAVRQHTGVERTADGTRRNLERDQDTAVGIFTDLGGYAEAATAQRAEQAAGGYKEEDAEQNSKEQLREESGLETGTKSRQENTTEMESDLEFELPAGDGQNEVGGNSEGRSRVPTSSYNIGKSGKMYTEEELELLIKE